MVSDCQEMRQEQNCILSPAEAERILNMEIIDIKHYLED